MNTTARSPRIAAPSTPLSPPSVPCTNRRVIRARAPMGAVDGGTRPRGCPADQSCAEPPTDGPAAVSTALPLTSRTTDTTWSMLSCRGSADGCAPTATSIALERAGTRTSAAYDPGTPDPSSCAPGTDSAGPVAGIDELAEATLWSDSLSTVEDPSGPTTIVVGPASCPAGFDDPPPRADGLLLPQATRISATPA